MTVLIGKSVIYTGAKPRRMRVGSSKEGSSTATGTLISQPARSRRGFFTSTRLPASSQSDGAHGRGLSSSMSVGSHTVGYALQHGQGRLSQHPSAERLATPTPCPKDGCSEGGGDPVPWDGCPFPNRSRVGENRLEQGETVELGNTCRLVTLIEITLARRGRGIEGDPVRIVTQWWTTDGVLVVEKDEWADAQYTHKAVGPLE